MLITVKGKVHIGGELYIHWKGHLPQHQSFDELWDTRSEEDSALQKLSVNLHVGETIH